MTEDEQLTKARAFIGRIGRNVKTRLRGSNHAGYTILGSGGTGIGFVRFNKRGNYTVYVLTDDPQVDPEGRFVPQSKNPKDRRYTFPSADSKALEYAVRAVKRALNLG